MKTFFPIALALLPLTGCSHPLRPGQSDVPLGLKARPGVFSDINPRWSHDGRRIAFLRATPDRKMQLHVIDYALTQSLGRPQAQLASELLCPDRPYSPALQRYNSPDTLVWSPHDRSIAFERLEWFTLGENERLPGTGLWSFDTTTHDVQPLAVHSSAYKDLFYYYHAPQWSPDGRYFAFVGEGINGQRVIFVRPLPQNAKEVMPRFDNYQDSDWPAWRPDNYQNGTEKERETKRKQEIRRETPTGIEQRGTRREQSGVKQPSLLAFRQGIIHALATPTTETLRLLSPGNTARASARELWRMRAESLRPLLKDYRPELAIAPRVGHLVWSPDGCKLAFTLTPDANDYTLYALWIMNSDGTRAHRISPADDNGYLAPVWIDNSHLGALSPQHGKFDAVVLSLLDGHKRALGTIAASDCDWSPDRSQIVYALPPDTQARPSNITTLRLFRTGITLSEQISANFRKK